MAIAIVIDWLIDWLMPETWDKILDLVLYERWLVVAFIEQIVTVVEKQHVTRVINERIVSDTTDSAQQRHDTYSVLVVTLKPIVANLKTVENIINNKCSNN